MSLPVPRTELLAHGQGPVFFDALVSEDGDRFVFTMVVTMDLPFVEAQPATERWPHHLPGEVTIALTGQAGVIALRRLGEIDATWRGHGVRIRDARYSAPVLIDETVHVAVEVGRRRRLRESLHVAFTFRMWKVGEDGEEIETYRSRQDAIFFPG